jgi:PAS domain S-box-containing protein
VSDRDELQNELESLRARLTEAEETLRAIHEGEVDALVVRGPDGSRIYTLKGADEPYRVLVERMQEGAVTLSDDGLVLYGNRGFAEMIGMPLEQLIGAPFARCIVEREQAALATAVRAARSGSVRREFTLRRADGAPFPALLALGPLPADGGEAVVSVVVTDLTEQKRTEGVVAAERFLRSILDQAAEPIVVCDTAGNITHASRAALALGAGDVIGRPFTEAVLLEVPDGSDPRRRGRRVLASRLAHALRGKGVSGVECCWTGPQGELRHYLLSAAPLHDRWDAVVGCIVMLTEISDRKRAEERQKVLLAELSHRVKNTLATVRSIATQTSRNAPSLDAFAPMFNGRLGALAVAHGLLTQTGWGDVELGELIGRILAPYEDGGGGRIEIGGPPARLPARQVVPMTLMLHELATNAAKYGALSTATGRLAVAWTVGVTGLARNVSLLWRESGGPRVRPPDRKGFGTALIERSMAYELDGEARFDYRPEGLCCELIFPLSLPGESLLQEAEASAEQLRSDLESRTAL